MTRRRISRPAPPPEAEEEVGPDADWMERWMSNKFRYAMQLKEALYLTDEQRYELAQMIPGVDKDYGGSWKELNAKQLHDLITMMEGYVYITYMKGQE